MQIDYQPHPQHKRHLEEAAAKAGCSVEQYVLDLLDDAVLFEVLAKARRLPGTPLKDVDFEGMKRRLQTRPTVTTPA